MAGMIPSPMSSSIHRARIPTDDRRDASDADRRTPRRSSGAAPTAADGMARASSMPSWIQSMRTSLMRPLIGRFPKNMSAKRGLASAGDGDLDGLAGCCHALDEGGGRLGAGLFTQALTGGTHARPQL